MNGKKRAWLLLLLLALVIGIRLFSANPQRVETSYSTTIYPLLSAILRRITGWVPFSIGDILYWLLIVWAIIKLIRLLAALFKRKYTRAAIFSGLYRVVATLLVLYIVFNVLWGINYNRVGITSQLGISMQPYDTADLVMIDSILLQKVNESKRRLTEQPSLPLSTDSIFRAAENAYGRIANQYSFLRYKPSSVKSSLWGWAGNYIGFAGYYNPFSGEAQVNTTMPWFLQPYTCCHEIAHQLGYAKENEANFVGYLAAAGSGNELLRYSVYLDLFLYAQRNLYNVDTAATRYFSNRLIPGVKADLLQWKKFNEAHRSPAEPVFKWVYGKYLQSNQQPSGILSYDEVTGFLIAYYKKFHQL